MVVDSNPAAHHPFSLGQNPFPTAVASPLLFLYRWQSRPSLHSGPYDP